MRGEEKGGKRGGRRGPYINSARFLVSIAFSSFSGPLKDMRVCVTVYWCMKEGGK